MARIGRGVRWLLATAVGGALLVATPGSALADGADVEHRVFTATATGPFVDLCTGEVTGTVTVDFKEVQHFMVRPDGTEVGHVSLHGDFVVVPNDPSLQTVTGHFSRVLERTAGADGSVTGSVLNAVGRTTDGTRIRTHVVTHHTENGLGITVVEFVKGCD